MGEIQSWCRAAAITGGGGNNPGAVVQQDQVNDVPKPGMLVPSERARFPEEARELAPAETGPEAGPVVNPLGGVLAAGDIYANCVYAATKANH
jgi:hypothetical protein